MGTLQTMSQNKQLIQFEFTTLKPIDNEQCLQMRKDFLVGREVEGLLEIREGGKFFIKWNHELIDDIWVSDEVARTMEAPQNGDRVKCTIAKLGPSTCHWMNQHPMTKSVEVIETETPVVDARESRTKPNFARCQDVRGTY